MKLYGNTLKKEKKIDKLRKSDFNKFHNVRVYQVKILIASLTLTNSNS